MKSYDRMPRESEKLYKRFQRFLTCGHRNLRVFSEEEGVSYNTVQENSSKWKWFDRAKAWDIYRENELYERVEKQFQDLNHQGLDDITVFIENINELRDDIMNRFHEKKIESSTALRYLKDYITSYRNATELYYINCRKNTTPTEEIKQLDDAVTRLGDVLRESEERLRREPVITYKEA